MSEKLSKIHKLKIRQCPTLDDSRRLGNRITCDVFDFANHSRVLAILLAQQPGKLATLVVVPVEFLQHGHDFVAEEAAVIEKVPNHKDGDQDADNAQQSSGEHV